MFVGYSKHHANDVFRMINMDTEMIINSFEIICLNEVYKDWMARKVKHQFNNNDDDAIESEIQLVNKNQDASQGVRDPDE